ncbi:MAG: hypothetical protein QHJ73_12475, partial [Armatimonadota bacterium]|nr:hypothetical protein [Armatimonadota bacterium]
IKVCNLLLDSFRPLPNNDPLKGTYSELENADPHVFYILDARTDLKPRGWELVNPLAPRVVDEKIQKRWADLDPQHPYTVGQAVTKNMACYWEVYLSETPLEDLLQFDLIFVTSHIGKDGNGPGKFGPTPTNVEFLPEDREKLAKLVDMGGIVWLEDCWLMRIEKNIPGAAFFLDINFAGESLSGYQGRPRYSGEVADYHHPLFNSPFRLTEEEINRLGDKNVDDYRITNLAQTGLPDLSLFPILFNGGRKFGDPPTQGRFPYIAGGRYGDGLILVTAGDTGCDVNDWIKEPPSHSQVRLNPQRPDRNGGAFCGPDLWRAPAEDLKFVYNILNWASGESNFRKGPRRTGFTKDEVAAPLAPSWQVPLTNLNNGAGDRLASAPVVWRNIAYFATEGGWIIAADSLPYEDRDGDGNPNDGLAQGIGTLYDLTPATPYDIIWAENIGTRPSALFVATVVKDDPQNPGTPMPVDALIFSTANGEVQAWEAMPSDPVSHHLLPQTRPLWTRTLMPPGGGLTFAGASAPAVSRGVCYVTARYTDGAGKTFYYLHLLNPATGGTPASLWWWNQAFNDGTRSWTDPGIPPCLKLTEDAGGLNSELPPVAAALVRDDQTGAVAEVAYSSLPTGQLAAAAIEVRGEVGKVPSAGATVSKGAQYVDTDDDGVVDYTRFRLDFQWVSDLPVGQKPMAIEYDGTQIARDSGNNPLPPIPIEVDRGDPKANPPVPPLPDCFVIPRYVPPGHRIVVDRYYPDLRFDQGARKPFLNTLGYSGGTPPLTPTQPGDPVRAPVLSGVAVGTGDTSYFSSGSGIVQAVDERGWSGTVPSTSDPN